MTEACILPHLTSPHLTFPGRLPRRLWAGAGLAPRPRRRQAREAGALHRAAGRRWRGRGRRRGKARGERDGRLRRRHSRRQRLLPAASRVAGAGAALPPRRRGRQGRDLTRVGWTSARRSGRFRDLSVRQCGALVSSLNKLINVTHANPRTAIPTCRQRTSVRAESASACF